MISNVYPVFEMNGEEYVADTRTCLTSNPPQYNAYSLKDKKHTYVRCSEAQGKKIMYENDFRDFMYGKYERALLVSGDGLTGTIIGSGAFPPITSEMLVTPVTHVRPKTADERIDELEKEVKRLNRLVRNLSKK